MKTHLIIKLLLLFCATGFSQNDLSWQGYFSYYQIKGLTQTQTSVTAASENALFTKNTTTNELKTLNSIDGLKAESISAVFKSDTKNITFIGNSNGLLLLVQADGSILYKNGILAELPVPSTLKKINHFAEYNNKIYISTDYGITVFDLTTLEFGDSYFIGSGGLPTRILQTVVLNNELYAVTELSGIKKINVNNPNSVDYTQWTVFDGGFWSGIVNFNNQIVAVNTNGTVSKYENGLFTTFLNLPQPGIDIRSVNNNLIITTANKVYVFNAQFQQITTIDAALFLPLNVLFTSATIVGSEIFIATTNSGLFSAPLLNPTVFVNCTPSGPLNNQIFRVKKSASALYALYGAYSRDYNPYVNGGPGAFPISKFSSSGWSAILYSTLLGAKSLSNITFNPNNENQFFVSSYFSGLLKVTNDIATNLFTYNNTGTTGLESLIVPSDPSYKDVRINGPAFDKSGNLWMTNNLVQRTLKVLKNDGLWQSYDLSAVIATPTNENNALLVIDKNNTKWLSTSKNGVIGFNENLGSKVLACKSDVVGNLPAADVRCLAIDTKNQLWIGTTQGLRYLPSVDSFTNDTELKSKSIIILEEGLAQELFYDQFILDIAVDGANRKWISTAGTGVYLVSPNGQQTIYHFTKEDSPLPNNTVVDIEIDGVTGEVYFVTEQGMVSFKGLATKASDNLENVFVYPNPVRPDYLDTVKISGLTNKATVKIADIEGNLVYEKTSEGGTIEWDTTAFGNYRVASGVYMIFISDQDGVETKVKKVMIVR